VLPRPNGARASHRAPHLGHPVRDNGCPNALTLTHSEPTSCLDHGPRVEYHKSVRKDSVLHSLDRAAAGQGHETRETVYRFGAFELHADQLELRRAGALVQADALVVRLLRQLVQHAGTLVTKDELVAGVWQQRTIADSAVSVAMARLRKLLGESNDQTKFIATVYGRGYRFVAAVTVKRVGPRLAPLMAAVSEEESPFVGRDPVLESLHRALAAARTGHGRACLLVGEPGIGKTRAVEVFERQLVALQLRTAWGYCREGTDTPPLAPFLRMLRELAPTAQGSLGQTLLDLLTTFEARSGTPSDSEREHSRIPGRHRHFDALSQALFQCAEQTPLMLVFDDLHRADAASLELLGHMLENISHMPLLIVATLRPHRLRGGDLLSRILEHRNCESTTLMPLPRAAVESYVAAVLDDPSGRLGQTVYAKSEGNPFFMVELSRQLRHTARPDPSALEVNDAALDLVRQRVARLDQEARGVLSAAAVIGRSFELPLLQAACECDLSALTACLDSALSAQVVVAAPDSTTAFAFGHELLRAVLYDALSPAERRRWHVRIADALEQRSVSGAIVPASELAHHLHAALPESDLRKTVRFCREASDAAAIYGKYNNPDVLRYLRYAREALSLMPQSSVRLRISLLFMSLVYARGCTHTEYFGLLQEALQLARTHGDGWTLVRAAYMLNPHPGLQPLPGGYDALTHGLELLSDTVPDQRSFALSTLACAAPACYDAARTQVLLAEALQLAQSSGSVNALGGALLAKFYLQGGPAHAHQDAALTADIESLARAHPKVLPVIPGELALHRTIVALQRGEPALLRTELDGIERLCKQLRHVELTWHAERWQTLYAINTEPTSDALVRLEALHRRAQQQAITGHEPFCAFDQQVVFAAFGRAPVLDELQQNALATSTGDPASIWALKVRALASAGMMRAALGSLHMLTATQLAGLPCDRDYLGTLGQLTRACLLLGALDYAEVLYTLLAPYSAWFSGHVAFFCDGPVSQLLGMIANALGRSEPARAHFEHAITQCDRAGLALRGAEARVQLASLTRQTSAQRQHAVELAREAQVSAQRLAFTPMAREAVSVQERLSER
jgi:DNA-binding winged helix-turn-helix (wHTH) protein